jgi:hypothetical protein
VCIASENDHKDCRQDRQSHNAIGKNQAISHIRQLPWGIAITRQDGRQTREIRKRRVGCQD